MIALNLRRGAVALLVLATASCEVSTDPSDGTPSDGFSLLIERRDAVGQRSFYTLSPDGKVFTPFTNVPADARGLFPSPDGKTIAYLREIGSAIELWAMDRDGANRRPIIS